MASRIVTDEEKSLIKDWVQSLTDNGYMAGWFGDKSDKFRSYQVEKIIEVVKGEYKLTPFNFIAFLQSDYTNLSNCAWSKNKLYRLLQMFGFTNIKQVHELYNADKTYLQEVILNNYYTPNEK